MQLSDREGTPHLRWRIAVISVMSVIVCAQVFLGVVCAMSKQVRIVDGGQQIELTTFATRVSDVLAKQQVVLGQEDDIFPAPDEALKNGTVIHIYRAKTIRLLDGKNSYEKVVTGDTVQQALAQMGVPMAEGVSFNVALEDAVVPGMTIAVTYTRLETETRDEPIPYETVTKPSEQLVKGVTQVAQQGENGVVEHTYQVVYQNGEEVSRELLASQVKAEPVQRVVEYGTKAKPVSSAVATTGKKVSRSGDLRYKAAYTMKATAYALKGRTASGMYTRPGVVAVDPKVIPLGSRLYIEAVDGSWVYGEAIAADTGGAIKGNRVDLYMETNSACYAFGVKSARVYVLE